MLRLEPTVICLTVLEVRDFERQLEFNHWIRHPHKSSLRLPTSYRMRWQSRHQQLGFSPMDPYGLPLSLHQHAASSTPEPFKIYASSIIIGDGDEKIEPPLNGDENGIMERPYATEQYVHLTSSPTSTRHPLPLPFAATARAASLVNQPDTPVQASRDMEWSGAGSIVHQTRSISQRRTSRTSPPVSYQTSTARVGLTSDAPTTRPMTVYDDVVMAAMQPQTPRSLPEARHQSRLQGSYTAPSSRPLPTETLTAGSTSRRRRARAASPTGVGTPGFVGLYGGMENSDESILYDVALRRWTARRQDGRDERLDSG